MPSPEELIEQNTGLVHSVVRRIMPHNFAQLTRGVRDEEDLVAAGMIGLMLAAQRFDPTRGFRFSTFAWGYIRGYVLNEINGGALARHKRERPPFVHSLDALLDATADNDDAPLLADTLRSRDRTDSIDEQNVDAMLCTLTLMEQAVLRMRILEDRTLSDIGDTLHLSRERIRQIQRSATAKLRLSECEPVGSTARKTRQT